MDFTGQIAVGYDGSPESTTAVRWAARLAQAAGRQLTLVHAWIFPLITDDLGPVEGVADSGLRNAARALLRDGTDLALGAAPGLDVRTRLITGQARAVLSQVSRTAELVVVGSRGLGGFLGMMLGSVSLDLITNGGCPIVVVRREHEPALPVLVGVDGSEAGLQAVDTAVKLAAAWKAPVDVVHVRRLIDTRSMESAAEAQRILDEGVARARRADAAVEAAGRLIEGRSVPRALLDAAREARIIVLGFQGTGGRRFGSVAHAVVHHTQGNAAITRHVHIPVATDHPPQVVED